MNFIVTLLFAIGAGIMNSLVIQKMWLWFVVPQFHLKPINLAIAMGLSAMVSLLTVDLSVKRESSEVLPLAISRMIYCLMVLGSGWIYSRFI